MNSLHPQERLEYEQLARALATMRHPPSEIQRAVFNALSENREISMAEVNAIQEQLIKRVKDGWKFIADSQRQGADEDNLIEIGVNLLRMEQVVQVLENLATLSYGPTGGNA